MWRRTTDPFATVIYSCFWMEIFLGCCTQYTTTSLKLKSTCRSYRRLLESHLPPNIPDEPSHRKRTLVSTNVMVWLRDYPAYWITVTGPSNYKMPVTVNAASQFLRKLHWNSCRCLMQIEPFCKVHIYRGAIICSFKETNFLCIWHYQYVGV